MLESHLLIGMDFAQFTALFVMHDNYEVHIALLGNVIAFLDKVFCATIFCDVFGVFTINLGTARPSRHPAI